MSNDASRQIRGSGTPSLSILSGTANASFSASGFLSSSTPGGDNCPSLNGDPTISLAAPRPEHQRSSNVYVDTPFQHMVPIHIGSTHSSRAVSSSHHQHQDLPTVHGSTLGGGRHIFGLSHQKQSLSTFKKTPNEGRSETPSWPIQKSFGGPSSQSSIPTTLSSSASFISQQPKTFKKDSTDEEESIICTQCGRCKCEACTNSKIPGGVWLFGGKCHCSPSEAVDYVSCLCCVKGVLYHCGKNSDEDVPSVDRLCSCSPPDAALTWLCLATATVPLPCLLCYWPLTWIRRLCEGTYLRFSSHGCRCSVAHSPSVHSRPQTPSSLIEKRLLHETFN